MKPIDRKPPAPTRRRILQGAATAGLVAGAAPLAPLAASARRGDTGARARPASAAAIDNALRAQVGTVVVIYLENRSFDNLFGDFPGVESPRSKVPAARSRQRDRDGSVLPRLPPIWGGLLPGARNVGGTVYQIDEKKIDRATNEPFALGDAQGRPLPESLVTRDLWHAFYQNQMQINGGANDGFVAWGDSGALVMGHYGNTHCNLGLWKIAQQYTLCDNFFMAAFGGSYLNHQFLISGRTPHYPDLAGSVAHKRVAAVDNPPLGTRLQCAPDSPASALDGKPVFVNDGAMTPDGYAVNSMAPPYQPSYVAPAFDGDPLLADPADARTLPPQGYDTIGDLLSRRGVSWAWYGGAWQLAVERHGGGNRPNFQAHHQPFNYFRQFAPGTEARKLHLRDGGVGDSPLSNHFIGDALAGRLPAVSFYKPQGNLNMHAGYSDVETGDRHVANVLAHLERSPQWPGMVVIVTFDENGGWWDHVEPPQGDRWGPGSRIPALVVSPHARKGHVDHTFHDTTSVLRFITRLHALPLLEGLRTRNDAFAARGAPPPGDLTTTLALVQAA